MHTRRTVNISLFAVLTQTLLSGCERHECDRSELDFEVDPHGVLDLAPGLSYVVLSTPGLLMSDGYRMPNRPDGMGCFEHPDGWVLMRNHELRDDPRSLPPSDTPIAEAFDARQPGGVTRLVLDPDTLHIRHSNLVLTGTVDNCGGGLTPYGWLTCEETTMAEHGFVFLCDPAADTVREPRRIEGYGRFKHEAAVFDPATAICYLTEDQEDSCLYRFVPDRFDDPFGPGTLQALVIEGSPHTTEMSRGTTTAVSWVTLPHPHAAAVLRCHAQGLGAAVFVRGEGAWFTRGSVVFTATEGGPEEAGQVFRLDVGRDELEVLYVADDPEVFNSPDGITADAEGRLYILEDAECQCLLHRLDPNGEVRSLARTVIPEDELAGACFSPDGRVLFVNLMRTGHTLAILGLDQL